MDWFGASGSGDYRSRAIRDPQPRLLVAKRTIVGLAPVVTMNRLSNSVSLIVTAGFTPSAAITSGTVLEWPTTRTAPFAVLSFATSAAV